MHGEDNMQNYKIIQKCGDEEKDITELYNMIKSQLEKYTREYTILRIENQVLKSQLNKKED